MKGDRTISYAFCLIPVLFLALALSTAASGADADPKKNANIARFGTAWLLTSADSKLEYAPAAVNGKSDTTVEIPAGGMLQIEWREPRDVATITIDGPKLPAAQDIDVQWWYRIWPDNGSGGWMRLDDPFNGQWVTAKSDTSTGGGALTYKIAPLTQEEVDGIKEKGHTYRHTYKIRLVFKSAATISEIGAYNADTTPKMAEIKLEWKPKADKPAPWTGKIEARNGRIISIEPAGTSGAVVKVEYADSPDRLSADRGLVVFRAPGWDSFSIFVDDVIREGGVYVRDIDAFVSDASRDLTYSDWEGPADKWDGTMMEKIARMPEQSLEQVMKAIPAKGPREAHLGVANMRQEFTISAAGDIILMRSSLRSKGQDADRRPWDIVEMRYVFSAGEKPVFSDDGGRQAKRYLEDGYLPVIHTEWTTGEISYKQAAFATMLMEEIGKNEDARKGDEPILLLDKIELANTGSTPQTAYLWMELALKPPMRIAKDGLLVLDTPSDGKARPGLTPTRGRFDINGKGSLALVPDCVPAAPGSPDPEHRKSDKPREVIRYSVDLAPGEKHTVFLNLTYIELLDDEELAALRSARFDDRHGEVVDYWKKRIAEGMHYEVPEPFLNDLWKANYWHVLMSTDRDPGTGLNHQGAATMEYPNYANETGMVAQAMEMRGVHEEAYRLLEPFLVCQGVKPLPGNFKSQDGLFYAAHPDAENDPYTAQGYNMHHGWVLWNLCEHYLWTRDRAYLESITPKLIAGCDWITRERQGTMVTNPDGTRPVEWGLAPAGDLEDVREYLYFYATNAYYYVGMKTTADVLAKIGHPEAERIRNDAEAYKADIIESVRETAATSPVVRLKDGSYVPCVPPRAYALTDRKEGWIREGLYPAIHLIDGQVFEPDHPSMTWLLQDLEDNIFLSEESGYGVADQEANFFNLGGFNLQPNLCPNVTAHLRRDEVRHFIRVFYNEFWASYYPDTVCFAEWVPAYGHGAGPMYKTPDECKFIQYMRDMLILEEGSELKLGVGVPRAWMTDGKAIRVERAATFFGQMDLSFKSDVSQGRITASLDLPSRNPAERASLRLRHPEAATMRRVTVNGEDWKQFSADNETITLPKTTGKMEVIAYY